VNKLNFIKTKTALQKTLANSEKIIPSIDEDVGKPEFHLFIFFFLVVPGDRT
jgi:hypothetical protein